MLRIAQSLKTCSNQTQTLSMPMIAEEFLFPSQAASPAIKFDCSATHLSIHIRQLLFKRTRQNKKKDQRKMKCAYPIAFLLTLIKSIHGLDASLTAGFTGTNQGERHDCCHWIHFRVIKMSSHFISCRTFSSFNTTSSQTNSHGKYLHNQGQNTTSLNQKFWHQPVRTTCSKSCPNRNLVLTRHWSRIFWSTGTSIHNDLPARYCRTGQG